MSDLERALVAARTALFAIKDKLNEWGLVWMGTGQERNAQDVLNDIEHLIKDYEKDYLKKFGGIGV